MARRSNRTHEKDEKFFKLLEMDCSIGDAAKLAGYSRTSVYEYEKSCKAFAKRFSDARSNMVSRLEAEVDQRILNRAKELGCYPASGKIEDIDQSKYSDGLLRFRMAGLNRQHNNDNDSL